MQPGRVESSYGQDPAGFAQKISAFLPGFLGKGLELQPCGVAAPFFYVKLTEYQGSQNKYHDHIFFGNEIKGQMIAVAYSTWDTLFTGAFTANKGVMDRGLAAGTSFGGIYGMFSAVPSGSISKDGSTGQASKPATVAFMWILRFV